MIIIALDEQGDFENLKSNRDKNPVFIGGVVYDDCDKENDYQNEKERLQKYMIKVCESVKANYPRDLHFSKGRTKVAQVKMKFTETIREFFENGSWNGEPLVSEPRKGKYYIFTSLRGANGKQKLLGEDISEALKDDYASNLYIHMAEDVVSRLVFHNPVISNIEKVGFELATRRVVLSPEEKKEKEKQYETLGFVPVQREKDEKNKKREETEYLLTNPYNYRTAIEREMLNCGQEKIQIDRIGVKSIYYQNKRKGMDFLYLADAICSYLGFGLQGKEPCEWIQEFSVRSQTINEGADNIIWAYDEVDDYFAKAWKYIEDRDYYRALSVAFEGLKYKGDMTSFYAKRWFKYISEYVRKQEDESGFSMAVKKYKESLLNNNLNQEKLVYIFENLEHMSNNIKFSSNKEEAELFSLYDSGLSAFIHIGNLQEAKRCFEKAKKYAEYVATETYLRTRNKMVVFWCDNLKFDEALKLADENVKYHKLLLEMKKNIFDNSSFESLNYAITLSQRGQVHAFLNDEKAEADFIEALKIMDKGTPDRFITQSYLMHYYICQGKKAEYEKVAVEYFGNTLKDENILIRQFEFIAKEGAREKNARFSLKYALYVYVKALFVFYLDELPEDLIDKLKNVENSLVEINKYAEKQINGHPWEMIYKYIGLIMLNKEEKEVAEKYRKLIEEMFQDAEGLIKEIADESLVALEKKEAIGKYTYMYY